MASDKVTRIVAAIERHLTAYLELERQCSDLADAGTPEAKAELDRLHDAVDTAEDELAKIARPRRVFAGWFESLGGVSRKVA